LCQKFLRDVNTYMTIKWNIYELKNYCITTILKNPQHIFSGTHHPWTQVQGSEAYLPIHMMQCMVATMTHAYLQPTLAKLKPKVWTWFIKCSGFTAGRNSQVWSAAESKWWKHYIFSGFQFVACNSHYHLIHAHIT
jgi:hypothetical protein